jgi:hypothetical protein
MHAVTVLREHRELLVWILRKGEKVARCILVSHPLGWELRLMTTDLLRSQVCRSSTEVLDTSEQ